MTVASRRRGADHAAGTLARVTEIVIEPSARHADARYFRNAAANVFHPSSGSPARIGK